jgi:hypothetical protein
VTERLPLWRALSGFAVLGSLVAVLLSLLPVYIGNYQLTQFIRGVAAEPNVGAVAEDSLRPRILERARQLALPVTAADVQISHEGTRVRLQAKYKVQKDLGLAHVDLHFHPEAASR